MIYIQSILSVFMAYKHILALFLVGYSFHSLGQTNIVSKSNTTDIGYRQIAKTDVLSDLNELIHVLEEIHPNLYHTQTKIASENLVKYLTNNLSDSISSLQFQKILRQTIASFDEGHTRAFFDGLTHKKFLAGKTLPFEITIDESSGHFIVSRLFEARIGDLKAGDKILSVNGLDFSKIYESSMRYLGGLPTYKKAIFCEDALEFILLNGLKEPFHSAFRGGKTFTQSINVIPVAENQKNNTNTNYEFSLIDNRIAYLNYRRMDEDDKPFNYFLDSCFSVIKEKSIKSLIIDLRENGGGNSDFGETLLGYITKKPFRMSAGNLWKVSEQFQRYFRVNYPDWAKQEDGQKYLNARVGTLIETKIEAISRLQSPKHFFEGKVFVLIGPKTFSSANMLADAIKTFHLATLIGEPTGEPVNDFGETMSFKLSKSKATIMTSTKQHISADGKQGNRNPVIPDVTVHKNHKKLKQGKDSVLDFAIKKASE
jgi:hypothetical protein